MERKLLSIILVLVMAVLLTTTYIAMNISKPLEQPTDGEKVAGEIAVSIEEFIDNYSKKGMYIMRGGLALQSYKAGVAVILDVRTPTLRQNGYIADSLHITLPELIDRLNEIPSNKIIAVYCENNIKAAYAAAILNLQGFNAHVLENGIDAWIAVGGETTMLSPPPKTG